jgi:hypothetical protein
LAGREKPQRRKAKNITRNPGGGAGMTSVLGKMISADADKNPYFFTFFRSASSRAEAVQPKACFLVPFLAILDRCATHLMGMQWRGTGR